MSSVDQVGEFLVSAELVHSDRWNDAVAKCGNTNIHLILAELAAASGAEDEFPTTGLLRERRLTKYQIDQIVAGNFAALVFGPFHVRRRLGRGGMAEVLQAYNRDLDRIEAVKVLRLDRKRPGVDLTALARREARVLASLVHPNITTVFRADTAGSATYISMEFVPGETVEARVARLSKAGEKMPVKECVRIAIEVALALSYAHAKQVVHRDVKPGNIIVTPDDRVKILDLGIAALFAPEIEESFGMGAPKDFSKLAGLGTPYYMAPEQWTDDQTTAAVDVYGLAATLYHMLVGRAPFNDEELDVLLDKKQDGPPVASSLRPDVPKRLDRVLRKALAGDPAQRYETMEEFAAALAPFVGDKSVSTNPPIPWLGVVGIVALGIIVVRLEPQVARIGVAQEPRNNGLAYNGRTFSSPVDAVALAEREGDLASAARLLLEMAQPTPIDSEAHRKKAVGLLERLVEAELREQPEKALKTAAWASPLAPESSRLVELHANAHLKLGSYEGAANRFAHAATLAPGEANRLHAAAASAIVSLASHYAKQRQFLRAHDRLKNAIQAYPVEAGKLEAARRTIVSEWAAFAAAAGENAEALRLVAELRKSSSSDPTPIRLHAELLVRTKNWPDAAQAWMDWGSAAMNPAEAARNAASCWLQSGKEAVAKNDYRTALDRFEKSHSSANADGEALRLSTLSLNHLGFAAHRRGDDAAAVKEYSRALQIAPRSAVTHRNRGYSLLQLKDYTAAEADYSKAIDLDRDIAVAYRMRAAVRLLHLPRQNWSAILGDLKEAVRIESDDATTNYFLAYIYANSPDKAFRDGAKAVFHAEKANRATNESNWEYLAMLAAALAEAGKLDEAQRRLDQAMQRAPESSKPDLKALAEAYRKK